MRNIEENALPNKWISRGKKISLSSQHTDLWIVDVEEGTKFYAATASKSVMLRMNPPDVVKKKTNF